jgi:hypothetical protein
MEISEESLSTGESDNKDSDIDTKALNLSLKSSPTINKSQTKVDGLYE